MGKLRKLTMTVDEKAARWAQVWAARYNTSVSRLIGKMLAERMREEEGYNAAMRDYLSAQPALLKAAGTSPASEELHDRRDIG